MSFENTIFKLEDATVSGRYVNVTPTGLVNSLNVILRTSAGVAIDTFETVYTEGDVDASITGRAMMGEGPSNALRVISLVADGDSFSGARGPIVFGNDPTGSGFHPINVDIDGKILESNSAAIKTAVQLIDNIVSGSGVNISQINGSTPPIGAGTEATAIRVTFPTDGTGVVNIAELPAATLIADNEALPTTSRIGAVMQGMDASGAANIDVARLAKAHNLNTAGTEYGTGVSIRVEASGGSIAQTYGAGAVAAGTQRTTLASDDPAVVALQLLDNIVSGAGVNITQLGGVTITAAAALADNTSINPTTIKVGAIPLLFDGVANQGDRQRSITNALDSDGAGVAAAGMMAQFDDVTPSGVTENQFAPTRMSSRRFLYVEGGEAHDDVAASKPIATGGIARTANPTAVAALDRAQFMTDKLGRQVVAPFHVRELHVQQYAQIANSTAETTILSAGAAGVFHDILFLKISNQSSTSVNVTIRDVTGGAVKDVISVGALGSNSVVLYPLPTPWPQTTAASAWTAQLSALLITVDINVIAVKNI